MKRIEEGRDVTVFRGIYKVDKFYLDCRIEANRVNFSPFSRLKLHTRGVHYSVPRNVDLGTVISLRKAEIIGKNIKKI